MKTFEKYLQEDRWSNDPIKAYNDVGNLAEEIKKHYFDALDALDRLKLGYGESEEKLDEYIQIVEDKMQKIKNAYLNTPDHNNYYKVNKPWE